MFRNQPCCFSNYAICIILLKYANVKMSYLIYTQVKYSCCLVEKLSGCVVLMPYDIEVLLYSCEL